MHPVETPADHGVVSHFSNALKAALAASGGDQTAVAKRLKMDPSQFNKYCNGRIHVGLAAFARLAAVLPADHQGALARAYLLDQLPASHRLLVDVRERERAEGVEEDPPSFRELPPSVREALITIAGKCHEPTVVDLVTDLARLLESRAQETD